MAGAQSRLLSQQSAEGIRLVNFMIAYFCITTVLTAAWAGVLWYRMRRHHPEERKKHGIFTSGNWHWLARAVICGLLLNFVVVPNLTLAVSFVLGPILAIMEEWPWRLGVEYVMSNVLGMQNPLTNIVPTRQGSRPVSLLICTWALLLVVTVMTLCSQLSFITTITDRMPESIPGLLRHMFVLIPVMLLLLSALTGGVMAMIEQWSFLDGFIYMCGASSGLSNPLISQAPQTAQGSAFECLCLAVELCLGGAIVGIVSAHPAFQKLTELLEGSQQALTELSPKQDLERDAKDSKEPAAEDHDRDAEVVRLRKENHDRDAEVVRLRTENLKLREALNRLRVVMPNPEAIRVTDVHTILTE